MNRLPITRGLPIFLAAGLSCAALACTALGPNGNGGWNEARRSEELARARALSAPPSSQTSAAAQGPQTTASPGESVAGTTRAADAPRSLDLATALELASRHNRSIAAAAAGVDAAAGDVAVARAALLPTNSIRGAYTWYDSPQTSSINIDPSLFPPGTTLPAVTVRQQDFANLSAAMRLAIDLSGELRHGLDAAQASYRAEAARAWATRLDEESAVTAAYFGLLEAGVLRSVAAATVSLHEHQLGDATSRFDQGRITRNEVLVVDVALAGSRQSLLQLDNSVAASRRALNRTTGLDIDAPTNVRDVGNRPLLPSLDATLAEARQKNPLVIAMLEEVQAADERLTAARRSRFPHVAVGGGYDVTSADTTKPRDNGSVGVSMEMDLYGFRREGEIAKLEAAQRRTRLLLDRSVRDVERLVRDSHDRLRERLAAIDTETLAASQAAENLRIREVQFGEGRATSQDLLDATDLASRQNALLASALYESHARRAELQALTGAPIGDIEVADRAAAVKPVDAAPASRKGNKP